MINCSSNVTSFRKRLSIPPLYPEWLCDYPGHHRWLQRHLQLQEWVCAGGEEVEDLWGRRYLARHSTNLSEYVRLIECTRYTKKKEIVRPQLINYCPSYTLMLAVDIIQLLSFSELVL